MISEATTKPIKIGDYCWLGMNTLVMSGVELGPSTIVGGGSIVTKSFPEGYCVIAGNPAKVIRKGTIISDDGQILVKGDRV